MCFALAFILAPFVGVLATAHIAYCWTPPIGVPMPSFGLTEVAGPTTHYVAPQAPGATDTNNPNGTADTPRKSIPYTLPAGAVVELHGTFDALQNGGRKITCNGTQDAPVYIRGMHDSTITNFFAVQGSYCILEDLTVALATTHGGKGVLTITSAPTVSTDHMVLRNSDVSGHIKGGGMTVQTPSNVAPTVGISEVLLWQNHFHHNGDVLADFDQDMHGITLTGRLTNVWVVDNEMNNNSGDGIQINGGYNGNDHIHNVYVGRNETHHNKQYGMWLKQGTDIIFSQNYSHHHMRGNSSTGACFGTQYSPARAWWIFNRCDNCEVGFRSSTDNASGPVQTDHYIIGNQFSNIHVLPVNADKYRKNNSWDQAAFSIVGDGPVTRHIVDNMVWGCDAGINVPQYGTTILASGNVFAQIDSTKGLMLNISNPQVAARSLIGPHYYEGTFTSMWGSSVQRSLSQFQAAFPAQCLGCKEGDGTVMLDFSKCVTRTTVPISSVPLAPEYEVFRSTYGIDIHAGVTTLPETVMRAGLLNQVCQ